ncbi:MAG: restriction modification system specificity subunit [Gemmataceae bacterium]|nr:restriction modification system specificity subunit [Gemmataceae bacterium]
MKYLVQAFRMTKFSERVKHLDLPFINQSTILDYPLCLPPIEVQQEFARRIDSVEQLKAKHRLYLGKLDELFASLQHRAFRGEL